MSAIPHVPDDAGASSTGVVVVAGGAGTRLGAPVPKAFVELAGRPLLRYAVERASAAACCAELVVVVPAEYAATRGDWGAGWLPEHVRVVAGGRERTDSVAAGVDALSGDVQVVLVHDAARALAPPELFENVNAAVRAGADAVVPGLPVVDTVKRVDPEGVVAGTVDRAPLRAVQTPQGFTRHALARALARGEGATDEAGLVERNGGVVRVVPGAIEAMKVTTPFDLRVALLLLDEASGRMRA